MNHIVRAEVGVSCRADSDALDGSARAFSAAFEAPFEAVLHSQDAPRVSSATSCLFAMTRLAKPSRLNSCASFFARPL
jgi:hypothetical protein